MKPRHLAKLLCSASILSMAATAAVAQSDDEGEADFLQLAPITITGEKQERSLQETASSVSVLTAEDLEEGTEKDSLIESLEGIPNVYFTGTVGAPVIRGQDTQGPNSGAGAFFGGTVPRATVNVDGHYQGYNEFVFGGTSIWDVESIEVFRGPQTVSQGANSIAGAIVINTNDPTFDWEGAAQLEFGNRQKQRASVMASGPITDEFAIRIALDYFGRDTFIEYTNPAFQKGETDQDFDTKTARAKLLWAPKALPGLESKLTFSHTENNRPTSEAAFEPYDEMESQTATLPSWDQQANTLVWDMGYEFQNGMELINQLQYSAVNTDRVSAPVTNGSATIDQDNVSNETRLTFGTESSLISGVSGLFLSRTTADETLNLRGMSLFDDDKKSLGIYSEVSYRPWAQWTLTAGLRYQLDEIGRSGTSAFASGPLDYDETFDAWLPKFSVAYDIVPTLTVGTLIDRGYNPGGVSLSFLTGDYVAFDPETLWNYELFTRASLLGGRLFVGANLFYSDFNDAQRYVQTVLPGNIGQSLTVNAESAKSYGLELEANYQVLKTLRVRGGVGFTQTEITKFTNALADFQGNEFGRTPDVTVSLAADWDITSRLNLAGQVSYTGAYYSTDENDDAYEIDPYTLVNAKLGYRLTETVQVFTYVNNAFNDHSPTYMSPNRSVGGIEATLVQPREFGAGFKATF